MRKAPKSVKYGLLVWCLIYICKKIENKIFDSFLVYLKLFCFSEEYEANLCFGGIARIISKVREIREKDPQHTLVLHAGDFYQGTIW